MAQTNCVPPEGTLPAHSILTCRRLYAASVECCEAAVECGEAAVECGDTAVHTHRTAQGYHFDRLDNSWIQLSPLYSHLSHPISCELYCAAFTSRLGSTGPFGVEIAVCFATAAAALGLLGSRSIHLCSTITACTARGVHRLKSTDRQKH